MQKSYDAMKLALRVGGELNDKRHPDPRDVAALRTLAGPGSVTLGIDELACQVIREALEHRDKVRSQAIG